MSDITSLEKDTISRNRIINEIDKNFFVEAGAGSGKTTMLVNRMVAMVEAGIDIKKICAITFTKAAAGEFYARFYELLSERSNPDYKWQDKGFAGQLPEPTENTRKYCAEALQNIDLCFMGTIDSFCNMVLSEHPSEAGIPSDTSIISDQDAEIIYKQEYVKICAGEYDDKVKGLSVMAAEFRKLFWNDEEVFTTGISFFMNNRNVRFVYSKTTPINISQTYETERNELLRAVKCMAEHPEIISETNDEKRAAKAEINGILNVLIKDWNNDINGIIKALKTLSNINVVQEGFDKYGIILEDLFEPSSARDKSQKIIIGNKDEIYWKLINYRYNLSMTFLMSCISILEKVLCTKGKMTFFDYLYCLRNMLAKDIKEQDGRLVHHIHERHRYFLIDEFQDTNPLQAEVFFYLCAEKPVLKWSACIPTPGSLFVVGDPKQSIYRFRGADVSSFENVKILFEKNGGNVLSLTRNFRSTKSLCDYYNRIFKKIFTMGNDNKIKFDEIPLPESRNNEFQGIYKYKAYAGALEESHPDETDTAQIVRIVEKLVNNDEYKIYDCNDDALRSIEYKDIMVITYGKKNLNPIMQALSDRDIPTKVEGAVPFSTCTGLNEIYRIYAAIAEPTNNVAIYAALTGKLLGVTDREIQAYAECKGRLTLFQEFENITIPEAADVVTKLRYLHDFYTKSKLLSPVALFNRIMDDFRIFETVSPDNLEVVFYAGELLRNAENAGIVATFKDAAEYIKKMIDGESDEERCLSFSQNRNAVYMANLHKVKGLEAPVVILSSAFRANNSNEKYIEYALNKEPKGYIFAFKNPKRVVVSFEKDIFNEAEYKKNEEKSEQDRLKYVAATRARNALIICDRIQKSRNKNEESHSSIWNYLLKDEKEEKGILPDFFEEEIEHTQKRDVKYVNQRAQDLYDKAANNCVLNDRSPETESYLFENPSRLKLVSKMMSDEGEVVITEPVGDSDKKPEKAKTNFDAHNNPALLGTMTHRLMEVLVSTKNKVDSERAIEEIIREYITPSSKDSEAILRSSLSTVAERMRQGGYHQSNDLPQDILGTLLDADEVYCEVPFSYSDETDGHKVIWNGIMDVVYVKDGKWHIVDYKTSIDGSDLDTKYQNQLSAYIKAFKATTGFDADAKAYHIEI